jgi:glycosyltransferase involved in cell wall biosynthesis
MLAKLLARMLDSIVAIVPTGFIAISAELRSALIERGVSPDRIALVPLGIDLTMFGHANPKALKTRYDVRDQPIVMYTGINSPIQRIDYLLRAFSLVLNDVPEALLMVVSPLAHDFDLPSNRALAKSLGLCESVIWVEGHSLADLPDYLAMASVAVVSRPEVPGHPIKLLNYMAAAKPIVCPAGAAKGLRHMHDAFIVPDHKPQELADGIIVLLRNDGLAKVLGAKARITVAEKFDRLKLCEPIEAMYRSLSAAATETVRRDGALLGQPNTQTSGRRWVRGRSVVR